MIHSVRRNKVPQLCLPDMSPLIRLAKFFRDSGLNVRIYIYVALFVFAAPSLVFVFNNGWNFI